MTLGRALAAGAAIVAMAAPAAAMASSDGAAGARAPATGHVVLVGIGGLRWSDVSPTRSPALWRLAGDARALWAHRPSRTSARR